MDKHTPIKLIDGHLGHRHKHINTLVHEAISQNISFEAIKNSPEKSAVDRLFKIHYASKCKNVDYIIENLKARNMLYVSRALRSTWLFGDYQYISIVNPSYLEEVLFPEMLTTAVNKTIHCLLKHLQDEKRYHDFYQYYKSKGKMKIAKLFLPKCPEEVLLTDMELFKNEMSPFYLKLLCEKCPKVLLKYFDILTNNETLFQDFIYKKDKYFNVSRIVLKLQPQIYFEVLEKIRHKTLSAKATKYIMQKHKDMYTAKPELYGGWLLHLPTLAHCLSEQEAQDLILRLARAEYLAPSFTLNYKRAEPLSKRINKEERFKLVKKIFDDKNLEEIMHESPYPLPEHPSMSINKSIFSDRDICTSDLNLKTIKKRKCKWSKENNLMDELFDKYRYVGFSQTLRALKVRLKSESSHKNRLIILNVLVSKTLKRVDYIQQLLDMMGTTHANEPITLRTSFLCSLVRRAAAYRLPKEPWQTFQEMVLRVIFKSEEQIPCQEGVHAILIHNILNGLDTAPEVFEKFISDFDPLNGYDLTASEKQKMCSYLYESLLKASKVQLQANESAEAVSIMWHIFNLLKAHKVNVNDCPEFLNMLKLLVEQNTDACEDLLMHLYENRSCRKMFTKENFLLRQNEASYMNALRHDPSLLTSHIGKFEELSSNCTVNFDKFFLKLKLYFEELVSSYLCIIEGRVKSKPEESQTLRLARGLCILRGPAVWTIVRDMYTRGKGVRPLANRLTANVHMAFLSDIFEEKVYTDVGAIATRNVLCALPTDAVRAQLPALLLSGRAPFVRLALVLAFDRLLPNDIVNLIAHVCQNSKSKTMNRFLLRRLYKYMGLKGEQFEPKIWNEMKILMFEFCSSYNGKLWETLSVSTAIPAAVRGEYCTTILKIFFSGNVKIAESDSVYKSLSYISDHLEQIKEDEVIDILTHFLENEFNDRHLKTFEDDLNMKIKILSRFLCLCKTEETQKDRIKKFVEPFLHTIKTLWNDRRNDSYYVRSYFDEFLYHLLYRKPVLDTSLVSCIPVLSWIVQNMHTFLDVKRHFSLYSRIHLTMLYYKTLQQLVKHHRDMISKERKIEIAAAGATIFGRYLAHENSRLRNDYFPTITILYTYEVRRFLRVHSVGTGTVFKRFLTSLVESLVLSEEDCCVYFAALLYQKLKRITRTWNERQRKEIYRLIQNSKDPQTLCLLSTKELSMYDY